MENYIKKELEHYQKLGELQCFVLSIMVSCLKPLHTDREVFVQLADLGHDVEYDEDNTLRNMFENELFCKSVIGGYWKNIVRYTELEYPEEGEISFVLGVSENWKDEEEERLFVCSDALISTAGLIGELAEKAYTKIFLEERKMNQ